MTGWRTGAAIALLLLALVVAIGWLQGRGLLALSDQELMGRLAQMHGTAIGSVVTPIMRAATAAGDSSTRVVIAALVTLLLILRRRRGEALWLVGAVAGVALLNWSLKQAFARARPELIDHLVAVHSYSFPSGHSANGLVLCLALAVLGGRRWGWWAAGLVALAIGVSRVYLGVHWPSDVIAGWLTGSAWLIFWYAARRGRWTARAAA